MYKEPKANKEWITITCLTLARYWHGKKYNKNFEKRKSSMMIHIHSTSRWWEEGELTCHVQSMSMGTKQNEVNKLKGIMFK